MKIKIDSQIHIEFPTKEIKDFCRQQLEINNPEIQKKKAMGFWTGNIPKKIKMYSVNEGNYTLPIGEINNVWNLHPALEDYTINWGKHNKLDFPENNLKLYDYQEKAVNKMQCHKQGILSSKCGSGKSIMALELIKRIGYKALIICEKKEIQNQFKDYLENNFNMKKGDYGLIKEGKVEIGKYVTIALRQTLANIDLLQYKFEWGTIIVDECQNVGRKCNKMYSVFKNIE
jgi:superfamily II DNA or RNA helicase